MKTTYQNVWDAAKALLGGKFTGLNTYIRKEVRYKITYINFYLRMLEKEN